MWHSLVHRHFSHQNVLPPLIAREDEPMEEELYFLLS
jgi:hypothetical protein